MTASEITHDPARRRYSLVADGKEAYLTYVHPRPGVRNITHTIVPDAIGGRGYGQRLVKRAVEDAIEAGDRLMASCWFARALIDKSAEWAALKA